MKRQITTPRPFTVFAVTGERVIVRPVGGPWTDPGHRASSVYATEQDKDGAVFHRPAAGRLKRVAGSLGPPIQPERVAGTGSGVGPPRRLIATRRRPSSNATSVRIAMPAPMQIPAIVSVAQWAPR
jgi:hypothetical protein